MAVSIRSLSEEGTDVGGFLLSRLGQIGGRREGLVIRGSKDSICIGGMGSICTEVGLVYNIIYVGHYCMEGIDLGCQINAGNVFRGGNAFGEETGHADRAGGKGNNGIIVFPLLWYEKEKVCLVFRFIEKKIFESDGGP